MDEATLQERINALHQTDDQVEPHILRARTKCARAYLSWDSKEDELVREMFNIGNSIPFIAKKLQRSGHAVTSRMQLLDITNQSYDKAEESCENDNAEQNQEQVLNVIRYWRNSLSDQMRMGLSFKKMKEGERFSRELFKKGKLPAAKIEHFFTEEEERLKNKRKLQKDTFKKQEEDVITQLQVIIAPYTVYKHFEHGTRMGNSERIKEVLPLWLIAVLTRSGELILTEENIYPWINRHCLTPNEEEFDYPIIGDVCDLDAFYVTNAHLFEKNKMNWEGLFSFALEMFNEFTSKNNRDIFSKQNYFLAEYGYILPYNEATGISSTLMNTYDEYIFGKKKKVPPLLSDFCSIKKPIYCNNKSQLELFSGSRQHLGQMQSTYPLSVSQRVSLSYFSDTSSNNIFPIQGPPGTGKTTLFLSIIATNWVEAAIKKERPPIVVAASTNNLAVTNILDSFKVAYALNSLTVNARWLPDFCDYGLYLPSSSKRNIAEENNYLYQSKGNGLDSVAKFYSDEYREKSQLFFIKKFNDFYKLNETDLLRCQEYIHAQMQEKRDLITNIIDLACEYYTFLENIARDHGEIEEVKLKTSNLQIVQGDLEIEIKNIKTIKYDWFLYKSTQIKWLRIFAWIPFVHSLLKDKVKIFTAKHHEVFDKTLENIDLIEQFFDMKIEEKVTEYNNIQERLSSLVHLLETFSKLNQNKINFESKLNITFHIDEILNFSDSQNLLCQLDITLRHELFLLATHYWEAAWLLENKLIHRLPDNITGRRTFWEIQAMLTPCFVTTLHSGPTFFQYKAPSQRFETLTDFIDLLIIDEAGQVMPAIAGAMLSICKKTLLVGDTRQIEPIFSLIESIDFANMKKFNLCTDELDYEHLKELSISCSGDFRTGHAYGNALLVGIHKAKYHLTENKLPGMFLREHRRCAAEIISYCNELCYDNQLTLLTAEKSSPFPRMGYGHIKGRSERKGSSLFNKDDAEAIACWIVKNKNKILNACEEDSLDACIGIITPFSAQGATIESALKKYSLDIKKAGTIHSLQGAEKPIIIFSSVYSAEDEKNIFFFDRSPNMLNVAVSRAKMSFLVFGDIDIFDPHGGHKPSSLLAKYLFSSQNNELTDVIQPKFKYVGDQEIQQINSLDGHRQALISSFRYATNELNIVSPFLRVSAIEEDLISELIRNNYGHYDINIYTDPTLNQKHLNEFNRAQHILKSAGASVILVRNVHSKIITIDDKIIIEGSFNWLAASRIINAFKREESSIIYRGKHASKFILEALEPIRKKIINGTLSLTDMVE